MTAQVSQAAVPAEPLDDLDPIARWIVVVATSEARLARHPEVSSAHIVLATWLAVGTPLGEALRAAGFSGRVAKAWLEHEIRPEERSDDPVVDGRLIARARCFAQDGGAIAIRAVHLFQAATETAESDGVRMIRAQGISPQRVQTDAAHTPGVAPIPSIVEQLDEEAQAVVVRAGELANEIGHTRIRIGHLLLALTSVPSPAQVTLHDAKITPEATRLALLAAHGREDQQVPQAHVPFDEDAQEVLANVHDSAASLPTGRVSATDLLVAIMGRDHGDHIEIMHTLGADFERLQRNLGVSRGGTARPTGHDGALESDVDAQLHGTGPAGASESKGAASTTKPRRAANLAALRIGPMHERRPNLGWRPELVLVALIYLGVLAKPANDRWTALGLVMAAVGAVAVGAGALVRARSRRGPWRTIRLLSAGALGLAAVGILLGTAFG